MIDRHQLVTESKKLKENGADLENILTILRNEGCSKIDSIAVLREALDISLGDAKGLVHCSSTWRDVREQDDAFHDRLIDALDEAGWINPKA